MFIKKHASTVLHVYWTGVLRIASCNSCCKCWYFTFNGAECSGPLTIDGLVYIGSGKSQDLHRVDNMFISLSHLITPFQIGFSTINKWFHLSLL